MNAAKKPVIGPGPAAILQHEVSIEADVRRGIEHAVILTEETEWRERLFGRSTITYHLRAKILSAEARSLANVDISPGLGEPKIRRWWARTILPDGSVLELSQDKLQYQTLVEHRHMAVRTLRAALPGVEPGCIIDYGYEVDVERAASDRTIVLQREWTVLDWKYRWYPDRRLSAAMMMSHGAGLDVKMQRLGDSFLVTATDLPSVPDELYMPPEGGVRTSVTLYYMLESFRDSDKYWRSEAKRFVQNANRFNNDRRGMRQALEAMSLPADADLRAKLRLVYDWLGENIDNRGLRTSERAEFDEEDKRERDTNTWVLKNREANGWQLDQLFLGFARELGAEADLVSVVDRRFGFWTEHYMEWRQFDGAVVAVRAPGESLEQADFVDAGSGLPYGQVPWFYSGVDGVRMTSKGFERVMVPLPDHRESVTRIGASLSFVDGNDAAVVEWSRDYSPQAGLLWRRELRRLDPKDREDRLFELCGDSNTFAVDEARAPDLSRPTGSLRIECVGELDTGGIPENVGRFHFGVTSLWDLAVPELPPGDRFHPVIFDHARVEISEVEIGAPIGFHPVEPPSPEKVESQFGRYSLQVNRTEIGYKVNRAFALLPVHVVPGNYDELVEYLDEVRRLDATSVVFERSR